MKFDVLFTRAMTCFARDTQLCDMGRQSSGLGVKTGNAVHAVALDAAIIPDRRDLRLIRRVKHCVVAEDPAFLSKVVVERKLNQQSRRRVRDPIHLDVV